MHRLSAQRPGLEGLEARTLLSTVHGDFNGDGNDDLAVGIPGADVQRVGSGVWGDAGAVAVTMGSYNGLSPSTSRIWTQDTPGVLDQAGHNDRFGETLATGDFNGDGYDDLAIGAPDEDIQSSGYHNSAGAVTILYGSRNGITATGNQFWNQNVFGVTNSVHSDDYFGAALAVGDFNVDGVDDLVVGVPGEDHPHGLLPTIKDGGAIHVLYGSRGTGLTTRDSQFWRQGRDGIQDNAEPGDHFGSSLAVGDFDGNGMDDLAIGAPSEDIGGVADAGAVHVIFGSPITSRLDGDKDQFWHQGLRVNGFSFPDRAETRDRFGFSLTAGNFHGQAFDQLVVGTPYEDSYGMIDSGIVQVMTWGEDPVRGQLTFSVQLITQNTLWSHNSGFSLSDRSEHSDHFGYALAVGNFGGSVNTSHHDLAIGVPGEDLTSPHGHLVRNAGAVHIVYGGQADPRYYPAGLRPQGSEFRHQNNIGDPNRHPDSTAETNDNFGISLSVGNFDRTRFGFDDLVVGVPLEDVNGVTDAGAVHVIYFTLQLPKPLPTYMYDYYNQFLYLAGLFFQSELSSSQGDGFGAYHRSF